jgi:hypothetical protein
MSFKQTLVRLSIRLSFLSKFHSAVALTDDIQHSMDTLPLLAALANDNVIYRTRENPQKQIPPHKWSEKQQESLHFNLNFNYNRYSGH